ncbi:MAG: sodium:solute symporter, partial [Xanthomonadales bacterium]|nr:sodium:solute symporter [Xanthomonadales bacterium]
ASTLAWQSGALLATVADDGGSTLWRLDGARAWTPVGPPLAAGVPSAAHAIGQAHVLYLVPGGTGQPAQAITYNTITASWSPTDALKIPPGVVVALRHDGLAWTGAGETAQAGFRAGKLLLTWPDWTVLAVYLSSMAGVGAWFWLREKRASTDSFFVGSRAIPFWAAGVSLYATNVSSISFIAIPAKAFESNWTYLANNLIAVLGLVFVAIWIVPLLRRLNLVSVFSYLETRFHPGIRMLASAMCIATQVGSRMSVILYLPALAIASITGVDVVWSILMMGVFTILYTTLGGMKAVIWTDFAQVFVMFGGALFAIVFILAGVDGSALDAVSHALAEGKLKTFDLDFDLAKATVWGFVFLVLFDVVLTFPKDQVLMQRVLSTPSDRAAGRSVWIFAAMMIPGGLLFYGIGTALWLYYRDHPERMNPVLPIDATFPLFIAAELPAGVTGLIIAGIFAAAMSTLSSIINSVATMATVDFHDRLVRERSPQRSVRFAEWTGVVVGLVGIGLALVLSRFDIRSLFDVSIELLGLLGGGFAGAYTLGMFTRRANSAGVAIGICVSLAVTFAIWTLRIVHPYYYLAISIAICIVVGYVASLFFPPPQRSLEGLTIHTRGKQAAPH